MIFSLGFLFAGLLTLLFLPLFWKRAVRLSRRRLEMQMPLSMTEIVAERDQLRAEFAVERRRLEQNAEALTVKHAQSLSEIGRAAGAALAADEQLRAISKESALRGDELAAALARIAELEAQFSALHNEHHDLAALLKRRAEELADLQRLHRSLTEVADERRTTIAGLETRASGLDMRLADVLRDLATARAAHAQSAEAARGLGEQRDAAQKRAASLERQKTEIEARLTAQAQRLADSEDALGRSRQAHAGAKSEAADLTHELALAEERAKALRGSLERQTENRRAQERDHVARIEALQSQVASLKSALAETSGGSGNLRRETALGQSGARPRARSKDASARKAREAGSGESDVELDMQKERAKDAVLDRSS